MPLFQRNFSKQHRMSVIEVLKAAFIYWENRPLTYRMVHGLSLYPSCLHRDQKWEGIVERNCWTQYELRAPCTNALHKYEKTRVDSNWNMAQKFYNQGVTSEEWWCERSPWPLHLKLQQATIIQQRNPCSIQRYVWETCALNHLKMGNQE